MILRVAPGRSTVNTPFSTAHKIWLMFRRTLYFKDTSEEWVAFITKKCVAWHEAKVFEFLIWIWFKASFVPLHLNLVGMPWRVPRCNYPQKYPPPRLIIFQYIFDDIYFDILKQYLKAITQFCPSVQLSSKISSAVFDNISIYIYLMINTILSLVATILKNILCTGWKYCNVNLMILDFK